MVMLQALKCLSLTAAFEATAISSARPPNILLVLTDDQDLLLGSMKGMPATQQLLQGQGASLNRHFTTTPVCCPSRSTILTGRLPHNYGPAGRTACLSPSRDNITLFPFLRSAGYRVGLFGKHMNRAGMTEYCPKNEHSMGVMPTGVDEYLAMCPDTCYVDCVFASGNNKTHGKTIWAKPTAHMGYHTSIIGNRTLDFIKNAARDQVSFMAYVAPHAPHLPCTPAPWYVDAPVFAAQAPRTEAFNASSPDKHWLVSTQSALSLSEAAQLDGVFRNRSRTLLSVDDLVHDTVKLLQQLDLYDNTHIIFTSDHGFHMGQFRLGVAKRQMYDTDLRVPAFVTGPAIGANSTLELLSSHVDWAPTLLDMAGVRVPDHMDGRSLLPALQGQQQPTESWRRFVYAEYRGEDKCDRDVVGHLQSAPNNTYILLRGAANAGGPDVAYAEFDAQAGDFSFQSPEFVELYHLDSDPAQMHNLAGQANETNEAKELRATLHHMLNCTGTGARDPDTSCFV